MIGIMMILVVLSANYKCYPLSVDTIIIDSILTVHLQPFSMVEFVNMMNIGHTKLVKESFTILRMILYIFGEQVLVLTNEPGYLFGLSWRRVQ